MSEELESLVRRGNVREAIRAAGRELVIAQRAADVNGEGRCHGALTLAYQYLGQHRESLISAQRAITCFERTGNELGLGVILTRAAVDLAQLGDAAEAMKVMTRALEISSRVDDPVLSFRLWNNLAHAQRYLNHFQEALSAATHAIQVAEEMGDTAAGAHARANAVAYQLDFAAKQFEEGDEAPAQQTLGRGLTHLDDMMIRCETGDWPHLVPDMAKAAAKALAAAGRTDEAVEHLHCGIDISRRLDRRGDLVDLTLDLASLARQDGRIAAADRNLLAVETMLDSVDRDQTKITFHSERSQVYEAQGNFAGALVHHRAFHELTMARTQRLTDARAQVLAIRLGNERAILDAEMMRQRAQRLEGDVAVLADEKARLSSMARQDSLTGVGNRRAFDEQYKQLRSDEFNHAALLILDLDHFKAVNDTFGHGVGDQVLCEIGRILTQACRPEDVVCRFGGEEFIVLARNVDSIEAWEIADRLRLAVEEHDWESLHPALSVTASIGVAMCAGTSRDVALQEADRALYAAKDLGRNRVVAATLRLDKITPMPTRFALRQGSTVA